MQRLLNNENLKRKADFKEPETFNDFKKRRKTLKTERDESYMLVNFLSYAIILSLLGK